LRCKTPVHVEAKIRESLLNSGQSFAEIAREHDVGYYVVYRISCELPLPKKYDRLQSNYANDNTTWEERQMSSKYYGATNKHLITPINPDWTLYKKTKT
jgi:hypothetical protein